MKYMGSKARIAKEILPIILKDREPNQWYIEPFVGGGNMIDKVGGLRIGSDINYYLISLLQEMQKEDFTAPYIDEKTYYEIKENIDNYDAWLVGYAGFQLSYGAMWFSSFRRDNIGKRDYSSEAIRNISRQSKMIKGVSFILCSYNELPLPLNSVIYCDPPYKNTAQYKGVENFNHDAFWQWCRDCVNEGHKVFVSEYQAPDDFICVWQKEIVSSLTKNTGAKKGVEKLFVHRSQV